VFDCLELPHLFSMASTMGLAVLENLMLDVEKNLTKIIGDGQRLKIYMLQAGCFALLCNESFPWSSDNLSHKLNEKIHDNDPECPVTFRVHSGTFHFLPGQYEAEEVIRRGVIALQDACSRKVTYTSYSYVDDARKKQSFYLINELEKALFFNTGLYMVYQPKINLRTNVVTGFEALLRWRHPSLGEILPGEFLPLVENSALMDDISQKVINLVIQQVKEWKGGPCSLPISLNLHISDVNAVDFPARIEKMINMSGINISDIGIELLESQNMDKMDNVYTNLSILKEKGFMISLDDFGKGHSNINYLGSIPFNVIKLDRSIIQNIRNDTKANIVATNVITMLKQLGYRTLAEGVEDGKTLSLLNKLGCDEVQGYFYSSPLNAEHMLTWMHAFNHEKKF